MRWMNLDEMDVILMYGVKSVSAQSEEAMIKLTRNFQTLYQALAELLLTGSYVDDILEENHPLE